MSTRFVSPLKGRSILAGACRWIQDRDGKRTCLLLLVLSLILSAFLRLPYYQYDFIFVDEAWWANGANILNQGGQLYRDIALDKNPPIFWFCALLFKLFGVHMTSIHVGSLLLVWATSILVFVIGIRFFSKSAGGAAALIYAAASTTYYIQRIIGMNTETLMVVFSSAAALCYMKGLLCKTRYCFLFAGLFACFAFLTKPVSVTETVLLCIFPFFTRGRWLDKMRLVLATLSGFALGTCLFFGYMRREGILELWWDQAIVYGFRYISRVGAEAFAVKSIRVAIAFGFIFLWLFLLVGYSRKVRNENSRAYAFVFSWLLSAFAGVIIGRRYYANYFIQVMPPLALLGGIGLSHLWRNRHQESLCTIRRFCCAAFMISFLWFHSRTIANWVSLAFPQVHRIARWDMWDDNRRNHEIAAYLKDKSSPKDRLFVWGANPQLFFLTQRPMATIWSDFDIADDVPPRAAEPAIQARTAKLLSQAKPLYIVDVQKVARIDAYPHFRALVTELYDFESRLPGARLYRLRDPGSLASARRPREEIRFPGRDLSPAQVLRPMGSRQISPISNSE